MDEKICPRCGESVKPVPIVYGLPGVDLWEQAQRGDVRLGGCVIGDESPDYACPNCDAPLPYVDEARLRREMAAATSAAEPPRSPPEGEILMYVGPTRRAAE